MPLYDAYKFDWRKEEISLDAYVGLNVKIGFKLVSSCECRLRPRSRFGRP